MAYAGGYEWGGGGGDSQSDQNLDAFDFFEICLDQ
jgi:hypothetical protein